MTRRDHSGSVEQPPIPADSASRFEPEEFAVSVVRVWKRDDLLQMRVLNRTGLEQGDEHTTSVATTDIEEAVSVVRAFLVEFSAP